MKRKVIIDQGKATSIEVLHQDVNPNICIRQVTDTVGGIVVSKISLTEVVLQEFIRQCTEVLIELQISDEVTLKNHQYNESNASATVAEPVVIETEQQAKTYCLAEIRKQYPRAYMPWLKEEDEELKFLRHNGMAVKEIAIHLGRQKGAIYRRIKKLELSNMENVA